MELIKFLHANMTVKIGNETTTINKGVPQGFSTSPQLFNIFAEPLIERLQ
jgi:hypothetical protein